MNIEVGDKVKSISQPSLNGGLVMEVDELHDGMALCSYFHGPEGIHKQIELPVSDLILIHKAKGGFRNEGEAP